jgi:hypothetical protein
MAHQDGDSNRDRVHVPRAERAIMPDITSKPDVPLSATSRVQFALALVNRLKVSFVVFARAYTALAQARPLLFSVVTVVPMLVASVLIFRPNYETNDDPTMNLIVAGKSATAEPDEHIIFTHVAIGLALKNLYKIFPAVPWYGLYLFAAQAVAHIALLYALIKQDGRLRTFVLFSLYSAVVGLLFLRSLQFTTTAFLLGQSGLFLAICAFSRAADRKRNDALKLAAASIALLLFCSMIRWPVFFLVVCLAAPVALVLAWTHRRQRRLVCVSAGLVIATAATAWVLVHLNHAYYAADPRWKDFYEFNELRAKFNDLAWVYYSSETAPVLAANGWSANDLGMITSWFYDDPVTFGPERLQRILDSYPWTEQSGNDVLKLHAFITEITTDRRLIPLLCLLPIMYLALGRSWPVHIAVLSSIGFFVVLVIAMIALRKPPPPRVYLPALAFPSALALFCSTWHIRGPLAGATSKLISPKSNIWPKARAHQGLLSGEPGLERFVSAAASRWSWPRIAWSFVVSLSVLLGIYAAAFNLAEQYKRGRQQRRLSNRFYEEFARIQPTDDTLYVCWGASVPFELIRPTDNLQTFSGFRSLHLGWPQQCPFHEDMKERFDIPYLTRQLYERPNVVLIAHPACLPLYATYVREHFATEIRFETLGELTSAVLARAVPVNGKTIASQRTIATQ